MLLTGVISILQIILLPGLVITKALKLNTASNIQRYLYVFALSLYVNYIVVTLLVLFKIYYAVVLWSIAAVEIIYLFNKSAGSLKSISRKITLRESISALTDILKQADFLNKTLIITSFVIVIFYLAVLAANMGTVFYFTDTVNNYEWNKWAIDFAHNIFPRLSSHFPQLLPANWSICYVMTGNTEIHFFPKAIMPLFVIGIILMLADLAIQKNNSQYLAALIIYGLFAPIIFSIIFIADGNADIPVSFFAFLAFYSFAMPEGKMTDIMDDKKFILHKYVAPFIYPGGHGYIISFIIASAAAATKLAGLYVFVIASFLLPVSLIYSKRELKGKVLKIIALIAVICGMSLFWYLKAPDVMYSGLHQPGYIAQSVTDIVTNAVLLMYYNWGTPVIAFFIVTLIGSFFHKRMRYISAIMVIIPLFMWMLKYSSDFRNLSFVIPYMCLAASAGLYKIAEFTVPRSMPPVHKIIKEPERLLPAGSRNNVISGKVLYMLGAISIVGIMLFVLLIKDQSFSFVYPVYEFINKYYFKSHRIIYYVDISLLLHVEFYQRILTVLSLIMVVMPLLIMVRVRRIYILIFATAAAAVLNFTIWNGNNIIRYQKKNYERVDAHNYHDFINSMLKGKDMPGKIITNFKDIADIKIPGDVKFRYEGSGDKILSRLPERGIIFLKAEDVNGTNISAKADSIIDTNKYSVLLKDSGYILFTIKK
jgi:hypothetical protein